VGFSESRAKCQWILATITAKIIEALKDKPSHSRIASKTASTIPSEAPTKARSESNHQEAWICSCIRWTTLENDHLQRLAQLDGSPQESHQQFTAEDVRLSGEPGRERLIRERTALDHCEQLGGT